MLLHRLVMRAYIQSAFLTMTPLHTIASSTWRNIIIFTIATASPLSLCAQEAPAKTEQEVPAKIVKDAPAKAEEGEVVVLSPFVVNVEEDQGYQAISTTSGSRLNTSLRDTAAAIQPLTQEFLEDIGANTVDDLIGYANFESEYQDGSGFNAGDVRQVDSANSPFRMRGQEGGFSVDVGLSAGPMDFSDIERVEIASGPNSILFGFGSVGGVVSMSGKRANMNRDFTRFVWQSGSNKLQRMEFDSNQVLAKRKLAVRIWGLYGDREGWRYHDFEDQRRLSAGITYKPFRHTVLSVSGGRGDLQRHITQPFNTGDQITLWRELGAQTSDVVLSNANTPAATAARDAALKNSGLALLSTNNRLTFIQNGGEVVDLRNELTTRGALTNTENGRALLSPEISPFEYSFTGPGAKFTSDFKNINARIEQRLVKDLIFEGTWSRNSADNTSRNYQLERSMGEISGDPNITIPRLVGGTAQNPYLGRLYMDTSMFFDTAKVQNEMLRANLAYELKLGKWFGRHRLLAMQEKSITDRNVTNGMEIAVDQNNVPYGNANPDNANNRIWLRNYLTEGDYRTYSFSDLGQSIPSFTVGSRTFTPRMINRGTSSGGHIKRETDSTLFALQSYFLKERIVTTFGYRTDDIETTDENGRFVRRTADDPGVVSGEYLLNEYMPDPSQGTIRNAEGLTRTLGGVAHLTASKRVSVYFNSSSNFGENVLGRTVFPRSTPPPVSGEGRDFGVMFDVLGDDRLFVRINRFTSTQVGRASLVPQGEVGEHYFSDGVKLITSYLEGVGLLDPAVAAQQRFDASFSAFTVDVASRGYEVDVIANPLPNWTIRASYSLTRRGRENYFAEREPLLSEWTALWKSLDNGGTFIVDGQPQTVASMIDALNQTIATNISNTTGDNNGSRPHKFSITSRYSFKEGMLRGAFIGTSYNYASKPIQSTPQGQPNLFSNKEQVALFTGYTFKTDTITKAKWRIQLNVTNLLNRDLRDIGRWTDSGTAIRRYYLSAPRAFRLTTSVEF